MNTMTATLKVFVIAVLTAVSLSSSAQTAQKNTHQRYVNSDMVLKVNNINVERKKILIRYQDDPETKNLATELKDILAKRQYPVAPLESFTKKENTSTRYDVAYETTDSLFIITTFAQQPK